MPQILLLQGKKKLGKVIAFKELINIKSVTGGVTWDSRLQLIAKMDRS